MTVRQFKLLICGTRGKFAKYREMVETAIINEMLKCQNAGLDLILIEGCCPDSADNYAEQFHKSVYGNHALPDCVVGIQHFPSNAGNYLSRNIEMVKECDAVIAFWNGFSYGTAHTIAQARLHNKRVDIWSLSK